MAYKIPNKQKADYTDKEIDVLRKHPSLIGYYRTGSRVAFQVPKQVHDVGRVIKYEGQLYMITRKTDKGIYVKELKEDKQEFLKLSKNEKFIKEKELQEGKAYPHYPMVWLGAV